MLPSMLIASYTDEKYYNRGQDEESLVREALAFARSDTVREDMEEVAELTRYEMQRKPFALVDKIVDVDVRVFNQDFLCPICLGVLKNTMTTMDCMHRFCGECINKALRMSNKECPTCRAKCPSHRNLRPDKSFDKLVESMYPNVQEMEQREDELVKQISQSFDRTGMLREVEEGLRRQQEAAQRHDSLLAAASKQTEDGDNQRRQQGGRRANDDDDIMLSSSEGSSGNKKKRARQQNSNTRISAAADKPRKKSSSEGNINKKNKNALAGAPGFVQLTTPQSVLQAALVRLVLQRNPNEVKMLDMALPALTAPKEVTVRTLQKLLAQYAMREQFKDTTEVVSESEIVLSMHPPDESPLVLRPEMKLGDVQKAWGSQAVPTVHYQTKQLADATY